MKYVCKICGYIYDEAKEKTPFDRLPKDWVCPLCGAQKSSFAPQGEREKREKPKAPVSVDEDMRELTIGQLSALCSNLGRGCEKQYMQKESELYYKLADYFASITPQVTENELGDIAELVAEDLTQGYETVRSVADNGVDRGAMRVCVWGEKVTTILSALLDRYNREGEAFLADTKVWVCTVCGFIYVGQQPPELCPVCKVPPWKFEEIEGRI